MKIFTTQKFLDHVQTFYVCGAASVYIETTLHITSGAAYVKIHLNLAKISASHYHIYHYLIKESLDEIKLC